MPYDLQLVQINTNINGIQEANTAWGFPVHTNFHTLLMSYWMCGPNSSAGSPSIWPSHLSAHIFGFGPGVNSSVAGSPFICLTNEAIWGAAPYTGFFTGNIPDPLPTSPLGCLLHIMMSVDTHAQIIQVYINDLPVTVTGTWGSSTGPPPYDFNVSNTVNIWAWDVSGVISSGIHPAFGDAWISNTPSFVDLSVAANRRKFIDASFLPVDLGATGTLPFGYQPAMYQSVRPGGVATDILNNLGVGGGAWGYTGDPPTFQTDGFCLPIPTGQKLSLDNLVVTAPTGAAPGGTLVFLDWSDNRGRSFRDPVAHPIGERGAYRTSLQWQRLGYARDRVFRLTWSAPVKTALQGAWIEAMPGDSTTPTRSKAKN